MATRLNGPYKLIPCSLFNDVYTVGALRWIGMAYVLHDFVRVWYVFSPTHFCTDISIRLDIYMVFHSPQFIRASGYKKRYTKSVYSIPSTFRVRVLQLKPRFVVSRCGFNSFVDIYHRLSLRY